MRAPEHRVLGSTSTSAAARPQTLESHRHSILFRLRARPDAMLEPLKLLLTPTLTLTLTLTLTPILTLTLPLHRPRSGRRGPPAPCLGHEEGPRKPGDVPPRPGSQAQRPDQHQDQIYCPCTRLLLERGVPCPSPGFSSRGGPTHRSDNWY